MSSCTIVSVGIDIILMAYIGYAYIIPIPHLIPQKHLPCTLAHAYSMHLLLFGLKFVS